MRNFLGLLQAHTFAPVAERGNKLDAASLQGGLDGGDGAQARIAFAILKPLDGIQGQYGAISQVLLRPA